MAPGSRTSFARSSQYSSKARSQKANDDEWPPTEPDDAIVASINELPRKILQPFTLRDLNPPNPAQIQSTYEAIVEVLTQTTREMVTPVMKAAADDVYGAGPDTERVLPADTREMMAFFVLLKKVMEKCLVTDFSMNDLYRPDARRFRRIFSCVVNVIRFKEEQAKHIDQGFNRMLETRTKVELLDEEKREKEKILQDRQENKEQYEQMLADKEAECATLTQGIADNAVSMRNIADRFDEEREEKKRLKTMYRDRKQETLAVAAEAAKLKPYTEHSPAALEAELKALENSVQSSRAEIERLERRSRGLQTSAETFESLQAEVSDLAVLLREIQAEIKREEETAKDTSRNRDLISERSITITEIEAEESRLRENLGAWQRRTEELRDGSRLKSEQTQARMEELHAAFKRLRTERQNKGEDIDMARMRIERVEKRMHELRTEIEDEVQAAKTQYAEMESHVRQYMSEMSQVMIC